MMYGIIYKATNLIDGKIYIGQKTRTLEKRRKEHVKSSKHNYLFQRAIRKYGKEAFSWQVIDNVDDEVALNEKEVAWIAHYQSYKKNGYNLTIGGEGVITFREVVMFDVDNSFIGTFRIAELTKSGFEPSRVYRVCKGEALMTGGRKSLYADEFLNHYSSTKEASLATNIPSKSIQKSCSKECLSTKGFVFLYKDIHPSIQEAQNEVLIRMKLAPIQREVA